MGEVYVARADDGREVALKLLLADEASPLSARFDREGRVATRLEHPHIVAARESGRAPDGTPYIAMELLDGVDLETRLHDTGVTAREAVAIAVQTCEALEYAHAQGVVHRDLKPQNIFLCSGSELHVKVLDFGIARLADDPGMTATGLMLGTVTHMAPEQARGQRDVDARADVWSLGVVLYQCLTGRLPFAAADAAGLIFQLLFEPHTDLSSTCTLPRPVVDLVNRALKKSRDDRFPTAAAMRSALLSLDLSALDGPGLRQDRVVFDANAATEAAEASPAFTDERRLAALVYVRGPRDAARIEALTVALDARTSRVDGGDVLALLGAERWTGDEPNRAVRLALAVAPHAAGVGVSTGRILRRGAVVGSEVMQTASRLANAAGVTLDGTTAELLRGKLVLDWQADGTARPTAHVVGSIPPSSLFVGRDLELAMLSRSVDAAVDESSVRSVVVVGGPGMGKSELRRHATRAAHQRQPALTTLLARCDAFRRDTPFAALREATENATGAPEALAAFAAVIDGAFQASLGDALAVLDRAREKLQRGLETLAEHGPILVVIDNAQWQDPPSSASLRWIFEASPHLPLAVWLLSRPDGRDFASGTVPGAAQLDLGPLPRDAAAELVSAILGSAPTEILDRAGGHPQFLEELARLQAERGPASLRERASLRPEAPIPVSIEAAVLAQLDASPPLVREALKRAAIFGPIFWEEGLRSLGADLEVLRRSNLVAPRPRSRFAGTRELAFRSGMLADVAYTLWPDEQRAALHGLAADWLSTQSGVSPDELARHYDLAGRAARAAECYVMAAEASARVADIATTCAHVAKALSLASDPATRFKALVAQDDALQTTSDFEQRRIGILELAELSSRLGMEHAAEASWRRCHFARLVSDRSALVFGLRAAELAAQADDPRAGAAAERELAMIFAEEGEHEQARAHADAARALAERAGDEWLVARALSTSAFVLAEAGAASESLERYSASAELYARLGDRRREAQARTNAANILLDLGRTDEAIPQIEACIAASERVGNSRVVAVSTHNLGIARRLLGELDAAETLQQKVEPEAERLRHVILRCSVAVERTYLALSTNAPREACLARADEALVRAEATRSTVWIASAIAANLHCRARHGLEVEPMLGQARELLSQLDKPSSRLEVLSAMAGADASMRAEVDAALDEAAALADDHDRLREALKRRYLVAV